MKGRLPSLLEQSAQLLIATSNAGKVDEIREILGVYTSVPIACPARGTVDYPEEGDDYLANALGKANAVAARLGVPALGDDSGLEVAALGGRPGVHSARYGGPGLDDAGRVERLLRELERSGSGDRSARFVCHVALSIPGAGCFVASGECAGRILEAPRGTGGFGYDPVFALAGEERAMAELRAEEKNARSHRADALRRLFSGGATAVA